MVESLDKIYRWVWWNLLIRSTDEYGGIFWWDLQMIMVISFDEIYRWVWWNLLMRSTDEYGRISWWDLQMNMVRSSLISQSCPEDDKSRLRKSSRSLLHNESLVYIGILAAPYLGCFHWEKMELPHVQEILASLYLEWPDYLNKLEIIELLLINTLAAPRPQ